MKRRRSRDKKSRKVGKVKIPFYVIGGRLFFGEPRGGRVKIKEFDVKEFYRTIKKLVGNK